MKKTILYIITTILFLILFAADKRQNNLWVESKKKDVVSALAIASARLEQSVKTRFSTLNSIEGLFKLHPDTSHKEFSKFAESLMADNPPIRVLQFADKETIVQYVFPVKKNEVTIQKKMHLLKDKKRSPYVKKAIALRKMTIQGPFKLRQGGMGIVVRNPIFIDGVFFGLAIGAYDLTVLMDETFNGIISEDISILLTDNKQNVIKGEDLKSDISYSSTIIVGDLNWKIKAYLKKEAFVIPFFYRSIMLGSGSSLILALFFIIRSNLNRNITLQKTVDEKTEYLKHTNNELTNEVNRRKTIEKLLVEEKRRYKDLYDNAPVMLVEVDPENFQITSFNKTFSQVCGYTKNELVGKSILKIYDAKSIDFKKNHIFPFFIKNGEIKDQEIKIKKKSGELLDVSLNIKAITDHIGNIKSTRASLIDITYRKKLENRIQQNNKLEAIGKLSGGIAHDFNNILTAILGYSEICKSEIESEIEPDSPIISDLNEIVKACIRAKDLIKQILTFSRNDELILENFDLKKVVEDSLSMLKTTIPDNIELKITNDNKDYKISGDPTKLHQVILNLVTNSIYAMKNVDKGLLDIQLENILIDEINNSNFPDFKKGNYIKLSVSDTGTGIKKENVKNVFDPYFSTKEKDKGTGLGLSVVHGIIKSHQGYINVYSEFEKGTAFNIYLPATDSITENGEEHGSKPVGGSEKILLVDDELSILDLERKFLEKLGYIVDCEFNPISALRRISSAPDLYDLIVTDITMPEMNGDILIEQIKEINPAIPLIVCTGFSEKLNELKNKADFYLMKPIDLKKFSFLIRTAIDSASIK